MAFRNLFAVVYLTTKYPKPLNMDTKTTLKALHAYSWKENHKL